MMETTEAVTASKLQEMTSIHLNRKAAVDDTAFNHKVHDLLADNNSDDSDDEIPETKNQHFEFSNSYHIMRTIRLILFVQTLGLLIDNPGIRLSLLFNACCKGILYYSTRLHSRIFIDALYLLQFFWQNLVSLIEAQHLPSTPSGIEVSTTIRRLNTNPYSFHADSKQSEMFSWNFNIVDQHAWHATKFFSHYFLTMLFSIMSILFLFRFWQISDYSDRGEIKIWLHRYVADGWWKRGGFSIALSVAVGCVTLGITMLVLRTISRVFSSESLSNGFILSANFAIFLSITSIVWLLGYVGVKITENAFVRFVSQNVAYTSVIILKRAVKAKIDLGLIFVISLYMPLLYTMLQSLLIFTDWNGTQAESFRKDINFYVPCYFMGFPPYRKSHMSSEMCPVAEYSSSSQLPRPQGFFSDSSILQCDSYFGFCLYLLSSVVFIYSLVGYFYMFYSMIDLVVKEFKTSRWTEILDKLIRIRDEERNDYKDRFSFSSRLYQAMWDESLSQLRGLRTASLWIFLTAFRVVKSVVLSFWRPIYAIISPVKFLVERFLIISCLTINDPTMKRRKNHTAKNINGNQGAQSSPNVAGIGFDEEFSKSLRNSDRFEQEPWSISTKFTEQVKKFSQKLNLFKMCIRCTKHGFYLLHKYFFRIKFVSLIKMNVNMLLHSLYNGAGNGKVLHGFITLGGQHAPWRVDITLLSKTRLVNKMKRHVINELRVAKNRYISDHELVISFMDYTIDSSGLMTLIVLYDYHRMYWFLFVLLEMSIYGIFGAVLKQYMFWTDRSYFFFAVNAFFGAVTYFAHPYTEELDRWLELSGRVMVSIISLGLVVYSRINLAEIENTYIPMYRPWENFSLFYNTIFGFHANVATLIDILMVLYFYSYIIYILYIVGSFHVLDRMMKTFQFSYHDHILDMLIENLDKRTFGFENIFTGLEFVQQWDDIIKSQRRYALLVWPDVRPKNLVTFQEKMLDIKWASLFNLTLRNLRSSLGLTVLHTTMFQADGEVSRWIIHTNPELLHVQDSQNDTPITIALKECAYYLLLYGALNNGKLDDNTSYSDEDYSIYYPEVDEIRDEIFNHGEFITEQSIIHYLSSQDIVRMNENGSYKEPKYLSLEEQEIMLKDIVDKNSSYFVRKANKGNPIISKEQIELEDTIKLQKRKNKLIDFRNQIERQSLTQKRFPEDDYYDYFECGQSTSWSILRYSVPQENIFLDQYIIKRMSKFSSYVYDNSYSAHKRNKNSQMQLIEVHDSESDESGDGSQTGNGRILTDMKPPSFEDSTDPLNVWTNKDLQYIIPGFKSISLVGDKMRVPFDHPSVKEFLDWDQKKNRKFSFLSRDNIKNDGSSGDRSKVNQQDSSLSTKFSLLNIQRQNEKRERESRWKICKFAEILMSEEMSEACKDFKWSIIDFKSFNKLASANQGKIAQQLALVCHLNPPDGFVRISDWSTGIPPAVFDEHPEENIPMVVKGVITLVSVVENLATTAIQVAEVVKNATEFANNKRGRNRRRRTTISKNSISDIEKINKKDYDPDNDMLSDRIIHYLAEAMVCSNKHLALEDCELSYNGRRGWRAIARALRIQYSTFVIPSIFVPPRQIMLLSLKLSRNELDCGDCVYMTDILVYQKQLEYLDLSYNRIGARGMNRMCKALRDHVSIKMIYLNNNIIGPGAGKDIGIFVKYNKTVKVLNLSCNHLGEIVRFPTLFSREKLLSAAHSICIGLRSNKSLEILDLSHNHLGTALAESLPNSVNKHPTLHTLNIAGNDLGPIFGTRLLFLLGGSPYGMKHAKEREEFIKVIQQRQMLSKDKSETIVVAENKTSNKDKSRDESIASNNLINSIFSASVTTHEEKDKIEGKVMSPPQQIFRKTSGNDDASQTSEQLILALENSHKNTADHGIKPAMNLTSINLADNQLGEFAGHAVANLLDGIKGLTHIDISGNSLGPVGGERICDELELCYGIKPREFLKLVLYDIEERKYTAGRNPKQRKKKFTNLISLNVSRNNLGPKVISSLMTCLKSLNCGIVNLDVSKNPLGRTVKDKSGDPVESSVDIRYGLMNNCSLVELNLNETSLMSNNLVTIFGGLAYHEIIQKLTISNMRFDEPCCLQLSNVLQRCKSLTYLNIQNNAIGANGGLIIAQKLMNFAFQYRYIDLSDNQIGPVSAIYLGEAIKRRDCSIKTLKLRNNSIMEDGGVFLAKSLSENLSITDLDISNNHLTLPVAVYLADALRGYFVEGVKIRDSKLKRVLINDNPLVGYKGSKVLVKSLSNNHVEHLEINNIGAGPGTADLIAFGLRDPSVAWKFLSAYGNRMSRLGLNQIFWALRLNKILRVLNVGENEAGKNFGSQDDTLLKHGISLAVAIKSNVVLRELDLSYNSIVSEAAVNIFDAIIDNHTIKKLSLRGNLIDDGVSIILPDLLKCNNVLEILDLGYNKLGFASAFAIAEGLEINRSLQSLFLDHNQLGNGGTATIDQFCRGLMMNYTLKIFVLDNNKLGPQFGIKFAETIVRNRTLVQLALKDNHFDARAGLALLRSYKNNPHLLELALTADEIGVELWEQFSQIFQQKRASVNPDNIFVETTLSESQNALLQAYSVNK